MRKLKYYCSLTCPLEAKDMTALITYYYGLRLKNLRLCPGPGLGFIISVRLFAWLPSI